jgi:hypothetical protein
LSRKFAERKEAVRKIRPLNLSYGLKLKRRTVPFLQHCFCQLSHSLFVRSRFPRLSRLTAELSDLVVALPLMKMCSARCAAHKLLVVPIFVVQFIQRKFQTLFIQIAPRLRNAVLAWLRAGSASAGATPGRQAHQCPCDPLSQSTPFFMLPSRVRRRAEGGTHRASALPVTFRKVSSAKGRRRGGLMRISFSGRRPSRVER